MLLPLTLFLRGLPLAQAYRPHDYPHDAQQSLAVPCEPIRRVAIIGAGSAGASTAYHIRQYSDAAGIPVNITVFERNPYIGGRSTTVNVHDDASQPAELGASIFVSVNKILVDAAARFNLSTAALRRRDGVGSQANAPLLGIWNGERFVLTMSAASGWWDTVKLLWRYGVAPVRTNNLMKETVGRFLKMYEAPHFPWLSLTRVARDLGLTDVTVVTGKQFLGEKGVNALFAEEVVQASTRVNYAQNLPQIHGLEAMVCMATDGAMAVAGGNWQIFAHMVHAATTDLRLNTSVTSIRRQERDLLGKSGYILSSQHSDASDLDTAAAAATEVTADVFDTVILAAPYQFSSVSLSPPLLGPEPQPYVRLHVTLFTSPHLLSSRAFNLPTETPVPQVVLTTLAPGEHPDSNADGVGKAGFWSISTLRTVDNPSTGEPEWLYKIFSPAAVDAGFLARILGVEADAEGESKVGLGLGKRDVSWSYRKVWYSYPYLYAREAFQEMRLHGDQQGDGKGGLWYTAGIEGFISTMETSALMGKNVARLIVDGWEGKE